MNEKRNPFRSMRLRLASWLGCARLTALLWLCLLAAPHAVWSQDSDAAEAPEAGAAIAADVEAEDEPDLPKVLPGDPIDIAQEGRQAAPKPEATKTRELKPLELIEREVAEAEEQKVAQDAPEGNTLDEQIDPYFDAAAVDDYKFDLLVESIFSMDPLDFPMDTRPIDPENVPWEEWKNDNFKIDGDLDQMVVRFEHPAAILPTNKPRAYHVAIQFEETQPIGERMPFDPKANKQQMFRKEESIVVTHGLPKAAAEAGGLRIPIELKRQHRVFLRGRNETSMVIIVPQMKRPGTRAVLLCPRDYDMWRLKGGYTGMDDTGYEMVGAELQARGSVQAGVQSGFGPGLARASIQVTRNVLRSTFVSDISQIQYPYVSLDYLPIAGEKRPVSMNKESITGGMRLETIHHNSLNHKTVSTGQVIMTIRRVEVKRAFPMTYKERPFKVAPGACYAVIKESTLRHRFIKEKLPAVRS